MRPPNYRQARKQKEQSRKQRQEEKRERRAARAGRGATDPAGQQSGPPADDAAAVPPGPSAS